MPNITTDPGAKKETVYNGPSPQKQSSGPSSPASASSSGSTVYGGPAPKPAGGTVYSGVGTGSTVYGNQPAAGTVYSPARQGAAARPAQPAANPGSSKAGSVFFLIAGFSAINAILTLASAPFVMAIGLAFTVRAQGDMGAVLAINAVAIGIFVALGFFANRGSKAAFIIGALLYAGDTALLLLDNPALHVVSIIVHGIFLFSIFKGLRQVS